MDRIQGPSIRAPCGHYYDVGCMRQLFETATTDESLFPPSCCRRPIPLTSVWGHLSDRLQSTFEEKRREFTVQNRVYCAKPSCSRFLAAQQDRSHTLRDHPSRKCSAPGCGTITCLRCKNEVKHSFKHLCADSEMDKPALKLAKDVGWARCPGCATMVEHNSGCYHMTCRCKAQFCYRCSARWKTCACPQWEEPDPPVFVPARPGRRERPPPILIPPRPPPILIHPRPRSILIHPRPPTPPTPEEIRRNRSLPPVPEVLNLPGLEAPRPRQQRRPSRSRQQRRAYRILPAVPGDEPYRILPLQGSDEDDEDEPRHFIIVHMGSRERRPISGLSFPETPVAGPSGISRASSTAPSSPPASPLAAEWRTLRDSLEFP